jgi:hypothetical protein
MGGIMVDAIQGSGTIGANTTLVTPPAGAAQGKKTSPSQAADYKISLNSQVVQTLTYERTGNIGLQPQSETSSLEALLSRLFERQGVTYEEASSGKPVTIDPQTRAEAQALISEDGYWGVNQTSDRIFEFATAGAGGDPAKLEAIKAAIEKGFGMAAKSLGGSLPEISSKTFDAVMKKLEAWAGQET